MIFNRLVLMVILTFVIGICAGCQSSNESDWNVYTVQAKEDVSAQTESAQPSPSFVSTTHTSAAKAPKKVEAKGIYIASRFTNSTYMERVISLLDQTELNAVVIDAKNDGGYRPNENETRKKQLEAALRRFHDHNIYTIARIVTFKDPRLVAEHPEWAMQSQNGGIWKDPKGISWADPYRVEVWNRNIEIAKQAALLGFDEIQFDYVRFPDNARRIDREVVFHNPQGLKKAEAIAAFLKKASDELKPLGVNISADVFGLTTTSPNDMGIGQNWRQIASVVDYISPMVYPSHYSKGMYGIAKPDLEPYSIVRKAMEDALAKNRTLSNPASVRPWLQDFTAKWVNPHQTYGTVQVREQIKAASEQGVNQYLLWNPRAEYSFR